MAKGVTLNGTSASPRRRFTFEWAGEEIETGERSHGGVKSLLRLTKVQCRSTLACVALRDTEGACTAATFPGLATVPDWSVDSIEALLAEAWSDPALSSGALLIRMSHALPDDTSHGQGGEAIRMAVAPLRWSEHDAQPWGLLCLLQPMAETFDQTQCDSLLGFAGRMVAYFDARRQVLDEPPSLVVGAPRVGATVRAEPRTTAQSVVRERSRPTSQPEPAARPKAQHKDKDRHKAKDKAKAKDKTKKSEFKVKPASEPASRHGSLSWLVVEDGATLAARELTTLARPVPIERTERVAAAPAPVRRLDPSAPPARGASSSSVSGILDVDPLTGLEGLPGLFGALGSALGVLETGKGMVILTLLSIQPLGSIAMDPPTELIVESADTLRHHVRDADDVFRINDSTFAVVTVLRSGAIYPSNIEERLAKALRIVVAAKAPGFEVSSALGCAAGGDTPVAPEKLFRRAAVALEVVVS